MNRRTSGLWKPGRKLDPADFDEVMVAELVAGRRPGGRIRTVDYWEAVKRLHARDLVDSQIAYRLGKNPCVVFHIRKRFGLPAVDGPGRRGPLDLPRAKRGRAQRWDTATEAR